MDPGSTLTVAGRFRGPVRSGNGGVCAGLAAAWVDGPASVRLHLPPPLDTPMEVREVGGGWVVTRDGETVMDARPAEVPVTVPASGQALRHLVDTTLERGPVPVPADHPAPECFVCGPRDDGLRVLVRRLPGTEVWSTVWCPDRSVSTNGRTVDDHVLWGVLDCPAAIAVLRGPVEGPLPFFPALVSITASLDRPAPLGEPLAVLGWNEPSDDRGANAGTAVLDHRGRVLATAYAQHARLRADFGM